MNISIIKDDNFVIVDNLGFSYDLGSLSGSIHAIQVHNSTVEIEYKQRYKDNKLTTLSSVSSDIATLISNIKDSYNIELKRANPPSIYHKWDDSKKDWVFEKAYADDIKIRELRDSRDALLYQTDIYILQDNYEKLSDKDKKELKTYRQALRELPNIKGLNLDSYTFPSKPNFIK